MHLVLFPALDMQIRQYNFEDMRKREYEIWTCVWRKTLSLDMRYIPKKELSFSLYAFRGRCDSARETAGKLPRPSPRSRYPLLSFAGREAVVVARP